MTWIIFSEIMVSRQMTKLHPFLTIVESSTILKPKFFLLFCFCLPNNMLLSRNCNDVENQPQNKFIKKTHWFDIRSLTVFAEANVEVDLRMLRSFRVLRPLKLVSRIPSKRRACHIYSSQTLPLNELVQVKNLFD